MERVRKPTAQERSRARRTESASYLRQVMESVYEINLKKLKPPSTPFSSI